MVSHLTVSHRHTRQAKSHKEHKFVLKGSIALDDGARVEQLPSTENLQHAFLVPASPSIPPTPTPGFPAGRTHPVH